MRILIGRARTGLTWARLAGAALACAAGPALAHEIDLGLNADAFRAAYATPVGDGLRLEGGWLHDGDEGDLVHAGFLVTGDAAPGSQTITAGIGGRLAYLDAEGSSRDGYALGVGGSARWVLPRYDRFAVYGELYWAPDILSGGDIEEYTDATLRLGYSVTRQAEVYVGARHACADSDDRPSMCFDTGMHAGFNLRF
jgi:hypothetical protein